MWAKWNGVLFEMRNISRHKIPQRVVVEVVEVVEVPL
jgi:hypothetical protein